MKHFLALAFLGSSLGCAHASVTTPPPCSAGVPVLQGTNPTPFTFTLDDVPREDASKTTDVVEVDGQPTRFEPDVLLVSFKPEAGADAQLILPVLRDFDLEILQRLELSPVLYRVRVKNAATVPLTTMEADARALTIGGAWAFHRAGAAGTTARMLQLHRRAGCYGVQHVGHNGISTLTQDSLVKAR